MASSKRGGRQHDRPIGEETELPMPPETTIEKKPPRPGQCRNYTRKAIAESMPKIVDVFVLMAREGSVPHFNLITKFGGFDHRPMAPPSKRRGKSFAQRLLHEMEAHDAKGRDADKRAGQPK